MFTFFKNTGIQFFGDSNWGLRRDAYKDISIKDALEFDGNVIGAYIYHLLRNEWIPFSLDGRRNL